ncbi:MAG: GDP-mannose 4,6-dehydratase [Candidatus Pacebacteria bacterium]|nr:GDP-mannose 4,6-dehydratase [Candidatus Paceibacterota bacterium]
MKKALITGIAGQDGSYLTELLLSKGYEVHGTIRWDSIFTTERIDHLYHDPHVNGVNLFLHYSDMIDTGNLEKLINEIKPDEIYHLAAMSHVRVSFDMPEYTVNTDALGTLRILEAIKNSKYPTKFYMAASSEMFGGVNPPQNENTPFHPKSPYACAKVFSYHITRLYREAYGLFAANGMLFNHESPRRGPTFVTRKITRAVSRIKKGLEKTIYLGNLDAKRDWGFAPEYMEIMHKILQHEKPDDFVTATGETHSVREFLEEAFKYAGFEIESNGKQGIEEEYIDKKTGEALVKIDPRYFRPAEVELLVGDPKKAREKLNWQPKIKFSDLVKVMVDADFREIGMAAPGQGDKILKERFPDRWWTVD